jgi:hypothetical protein
MIIKTNATLALLIALFWFSQSEAQYVLILNNGRQISVQVYREESGMIKFHGFGGEIGISKSQVKAIRKSAETAGGGLTIPTSMPEPVITADSSSPPPLPSATRPEPPLAPEEQRAKEEQDYQQKLIDVNERLKAARDSYSETIRGTTSSDPSLLTTEAQMKARQDDIVSRALDAQYKPSDPAGTRLVTPSPFSTLPPTIVDTRPPPEATPRYDTTLPQYTPRQKELSELRSQTIDLEKERDRLIDEMNKKNFGSGKLFE